MRNRKLALVAILCSLLFAASMVPLLDEEPSSATGQIVITDSAGFKTTLPGPAPHVVTMGYAFSLTVYELGGSAKVVGYDKYSTYDYQKDDRMKAYDGVKNLGSGYSSEIESLYTGMSQLVDAGEFDKGTDVIIFNNYSSTIKEGGFRDILVGYGYKVVCLGASDYDGSLEVVRTISEIIGIDPEGLVDKMVDAKAKVVKRVGEFGVYVKPKAMYVTGSGDDVKAYNSGIAVSMMEICGAENVGYNAPTPTSYVMSVSGIIQKNPDLIFLDGNYKGTAEEFKDKYGIPAKYKVYKMGRDWNNYCPGIADGLDAMFAELHAFEITDSAGFKTKLIGPAPRVVTMGYAFSLTVYELGGSAKVVGYDKYSTYNYQKDERMNAYDGVKNLGSGYSSEIDSLYTGMSQLVDAGKFDKKTDVIIFNNYSGTIKEGGFRDVLVGYGYKVVCLGASDYDGSVEVVRTISKVIGLDPEGLVDKMVDAKRDTAGKVKALGDRNKPKAMYVTASGDDVKAYNSGIAVSMMEVCGAENVGYISSAQTYSVR
ncbi:MAG: hypothetical protein GX224_02000 [Thermoplasmatales archaeon]|nr:hypothetical protein [Thermoplasmatales archaeon]